eukprot:TRINITY_DN91977_c0_g1_i1.p1 TRINITY_DN91977_c0_g1~~TRINITY_DN91977_c0_g1_i1.p1  ORF type:complete len:747 (-),score=91.28 TRINITY_DN91977_c0_g1_i1:161-2401(-)
MLLFPFVFSGALVMGSAASCRTWYDTTQHGESWVSIIDFGAQPDGMTDATAAIQAAVDSQRGSSGAKRRATVYVPSGNYMISDTIFLWAATTFVGSLSDMPGCRSTLILIDGAKGFGNSSALKPMLVTTDGFNRSASVARSVGWWNENENANCVFYNQLHSVDLRLGANPGATGVMWHPAQGTSIRDMRIDARGAYCSIDYGGATGYFNQSGPTDGGGGGTLEGISTLGGQYGIRGGGTNFCFRTVRIVNAAVAGALFNTNSWNNVLVDVKISGSPVGVNLSQSSNNIVILDSSFDIPAGGIGLNLYSMNSNETGVVLSRVKVIGGDYAVRGPTASTSLPQAPFGSTFLEAWRSGGFEYIDDKEQYNDDHSQLVKFGVLKAARPNVPLPLRPRPKLTTAFNAKLAGAVGDCKHDDTAAIMEALAVHDTVFLPATSGQNGGEPSEGCYLISDTLRIRSNTTLLGEGLSLLKLAPHSPGFGDRSAPKPMLQTANDAFSQSVLMDLMLDVGDQQSGNAGTVLVEWRAGNGSMHDIHARMYGPAHVGFHITGSGGGIIDNSWVWGGDHNQSSLVGTMCKEPTCPGADVGILIDSAGPTYLLGTNSEHHVETSYRFDRASNVFVLMAQNEYRTFGSKGTTSPCAASNAMQVQDSSNVHVYGVSACSWDCYGPGTGQPLLSVRNATDVSFAGMYAVCKKDSRGVCYMLGAEANDTRFGMGAYHVVSTQWAQVKASVGDVRRWQVSLPQHVIV